MKFFTRQSFTILVTDLVVWTLAMIVYVILRFYRTADAALLVAEPLLPFEQILWIGVEAGVILGLIYGLVDVFLGQQWLRKRSYGSILVIKGAIHLAVIIAVMVFARMEAFSKVGEEVLAREAMRSTLLDINTLIAIVYTTFVSFSLNFIRQINLKFGPGNLGKFLTGKFHHPKEESRILMFLDMRASTTIAEKLGHAKFSQLVQDCFSDLSIVLNRRAEVYQYVGDEAILYWEVQNGLNHCNCLMAYFDYMNQLKSRSDYYQKEYGTIPEFKAGINIGKVIIAEVGDIKRDLAFLGDTMNTAARIQDQCNNYQKNLLISESLHQQLPESSVLKRTLIDNLTLKGKQQSVAVYAVDLLE